MGLVYNTKNGTYEYELGNKILQKPTDIQKKKSKKNNAKIPSSKKQENINYFDDGYQFGDITRTGIQLGKNLVKTPENFKDGYDFGDITKTIGASALDIGAGTVKGIMNFGESAIADPLQYGVAQVSDWMGFDNFANAVRENAKQNGVEQTFAPIDKLTDRYTAIGTTGDQLSSGIGNVIAMGNVSGLLKAKGLPSSVNVGKFAIPTTSIASGIGSGMTEAYNNGASDGEAWTYGALSGLAEGFSESLFGGLGKKFNLNVGEGGLDDFLVKKFTDKISNNTIKILAESGLKATGEGVEEILSGIGSAVSKKLTYLSEKDLETLIKDENLAEQFIMGTLTSLISQTPGTIQSVKTGTDLITGQPTNNQALTPENMQENVPYTVKNNKGNAIAPLGNNALNTPVLNKNNQSYNVLNNGKEYAPYVPINNTFRYKKSTNPKINALNESMVKSNFDNSIESKSLSEVASVIVEDKGWNVLFDNTITNKNGEPVNALVTTENGEITIRVNPNSTRAAEFLIMHEVTHGIETSELLNLANDYASKNPEFAKVMESLKTKYSENDIDSEVLADICGELFGNQEFIDSLVQDGSIQNKNIITKIYDAIKRLLNSLTEKGRQKNAYYDFVNELEQKWREAYKQTTTESAIKNIKNTKFAIKNNPIGKYVKADRQVITGNNHLKWEKQVENYINDSIRKNKDVNVFTGNGEILTITKNTSGKAKFRNYYTDSNGKKHYMTNDEFYTKLLAEVHIDELGQISKKINKKTVPDKKNHPFAKDGFDYRTAFFEDFNGDYYKVTMSIGKNGNIKTIYNVGKLEQRKRPVISGSSVNNGANGSLSVNNIPQSNNTVKSSTSVKHSTEENNNKTWREHLEENYEATGTRTYMPEHITNDYDFEVDEITDSNDIRYSVEETTNDQIQGLEGYTKPQIKNITTDYIKTTLEYADVQADIVGMEIVGSRNRGTARHNSDLDIVVELTGEDLREDDLFNILNDTDEPLEINGIKVDINPIIVERSGSLEEFMKRSNAYDKEQIKNSKSKYPDWINKIVPNEPYRKYQNYINDLMIQKQDETGLRITSDSSGVLVWQHGYASSLEKIKFEDTKKIAQQIYDLKATDNQGNELSKEQVKYFKDSKIRDEKGKLIKMYHATKQDFNVFDKNKLGSNTDSVDALLGFHFAPADYVKNVYGNKVKEVYLNAKKIMDFRNLTKENYEDLGKIGNVVRKYIEMDDQGSIKEYLVETGEIDNLKSKGYDGLIFDDWIQGEYVVFESNQIKNVDNTNPTDNPDIRYSIEEDITDNKGRALSNEVIQKTKNSKARDEKGNLLSLYHGSPNIDITEFDINKSGQNTMSAEYGIYFTDSEKIADDFSYERIETNSMFFDKKGKKGKVYEAYLNLEKPLDFRKLSKQEISDLYEYASHLGQLDGKETFVEDMTKWQQIGNHQLMKVNLNLKKLSNKYDGFIAKMDVKNNELEYVVFDSKQVLFVDKNNESVKTNNIDDQGRTLSIEQKKYFKDSKVRDENGNLKTVYHGSENKFTEFDIDRAGARGSYYTTGFYFSTNKESAKVYATDKGKIYETYLNITNPYIPTQDVINKDGTVTFAPSFYEDFEQKFKDKLPSDWNELNNVRKGTAARYILEDLGYDGVINGETYVAFRPNQIKNVDNTMPTESDDIRYSIEEDITDTKSDGSFTKFDDKSLDNKNVAIDSLSNPIELGTMKSLKGEKLKLSSQEYNSGYGFIRKITAEKENGEKAILSFKKLGTNTEKFDYKNNEYIKDYHTYEIKHLEGAEEGDTTGTTLLNELIKEAKENGISKIVAYDTTHTLRNRPSKTYWEKQGFKSNGEGDHVLSLENQTETKTSNVDNQGRTLTNEQIKYFIDSKVRDSEGRLLEVYHGTPNGGFTIFDRNKTGRESRKAQYGSGFYFTNDEILANTYTYEEDVYGRYSKGQNPTEYKVYLNITNPFVMTTKTENDHNLDRDKLKQLILNGDNDYFFDSWISFTTKTINELNYKLDGLTEEEIKALSKEEKVDYWLKQEFDLKYFGDKNILKEMHRAYKTNNDLLNNFQKIFGYDGIIFKNPNGTNQYIAFNSNQIKNVDNTNPTDSDDIRYSIEENDSLINAPKQDNKGRKLTKKQQEFYKNEDKKLLDENGNLKTLYHGTPYNNFTTFKGKLFCFSEDYKFAKEYGETKSFDQGLDADVEVKEVYVKAENIFDPSNPEHIKILSDNLSDKINYWGNIWDKETLLNKLQRKDTLPPKWKPEQIENKKFGDYIGDDRHGYNNDMFVGVNDNNEIVYISQERELNKLSQTEKDMFQKQLLDGKEVIYTTYQTIFGDLTEKGIHNKINELQKQSEEYKKENGFENEDIDYYIKRLKENLEWIKKDIFPSNNHKLIPRVATQESTELTDIDNWTYFETAMDNETRKDIVEIIQELGFDGVNMYEDGISNFAVFKPNQIKNVDNLNPSDSDDIRYSMVEDPLEISKLKKSDASTTPIAPFVKTEGGKEDGRSKHYSNLTKKSKFLNDKSVAAISNENGVKYYDKTTNKETLEKAKKELDNGGKSETLKWFNKDPKNADPTDIAKGWILLKQYQDKGDYDSVVQVAKKMRMMGTTTGKTLQMYAIMERLTPEGMVNYAQSELSEAYELMIKNKSKAWIDKHKSDFDLSPSEVKFIMDTMQEVSKMQDGYEKDVKLAEIQKLMTDKLPPEKGAGIKAWMRISMLFNPKTQVRNVLGNAVIAPVNAVGDAFASGIDKMIAKKTGVRTTGNVNLSSYNEGFKKGLYKSYNDFKKGINTRNIEGNRFEIGQGKSFNDKTLIGHKLNQIDNLLSFMLDAGDRGFYEATFNNSINNQLILNNTTKVTPEMIDIATTEALQRTWQDNNEYTKFVLNTRKGLNKLMSIGGYGLGDILIPFAKTPANLTKAIIDYSPVGLVHSLVEGHNLKNAIETGQFTAQQQHKFVQDLGKAVAGTMLYVIGYALAKAGAISGENDEDKDTANFMKNTLGISPYSIKIGNKTFTYDWAQPVAAPFAIMSDFVSSNDEDASILEKSISAFNTGFNIVVEQSFMQSIKTVLDNKDGIATGIQEAIMELPSRAIPTLSKQIVDLTDGTQRQTFVYGKPLETAKNKVLAKIPGASKALAPTVDTMGREIKKYGGKNNIFNVFFNPASVNNENISESAGEIYRLYQETGRTDLMPRVSPYYINHKGEKIVLSNEDKSRFQKISGDIIEQNVKKIMNSSQYQYLSDEEKADIIQDIVNYSYNKARFDVLGIEMSDTYQSVADYEDMGGSLSDYYLFQSSIDNENSETKKQSISNFLIESDLSDKEISYLYNKYYSSDKTMNMLSSFNIPVKEYIKLNLQSFESDYNQNGKAISGSKQAKIFNYINSLKLNTTQKAILMKMKYKSFNKYDKQILNYINKMNATRFEKASYAKQIGFDYYDDYLINYILKQNASNEEKIKQLKNLGFRYINGKIYK